MTHDRWHDEQFMNAKYSEIVDTAKMARDGKMNIVEGVWRLCALQNDVSRRNFDDNCVLFVAIASETDHIPVGTVREEYSRAALEKGDNEIEEVDKDYRSQVVSACEKLIARFSNATCQISPVQRLLHRRGWFQLLCVYAPDHQARR